MSESRAVPLPFADDPSNPFLQGFGPSPEDLARCVHCGLCLNSCPTYVELGVEMDSPRGRIALMRGVQEGRLPLTEEVEQHLDQCLGCRACEAVCPSGVPYGRIIEDARAAMLPTRKRRPANTIERFLLRQVIARKRVLGTAIAAARIHQKLRIGAVVARVPLLPARIKGANHMLPTDVPAPYPPRGRTVVVRAKGPRRGRVAMLSGCVMSEMFGPTNKSTARVLAENGFEVVIPGEQVCCGALHLHNGDRGGAKVLAAKNVGAFLKADVDALVVNAAGCGSTLKEYGELLRGEPEGERAERLSSMTKDVNEFLAALPLRKPKASLDWKVTYQDSCHLAHAQRIKAAPREVLAAIPGLGLREMETPDRCCGSAGIYSLLQPELSGRLLESKMDDIATTGADVIVTANPGCMMQLDAGARGRGTGQRVMHTVDVLAAAYRAEDALTSG